MGEWSYSPRIRYLWKMSARHPSCFSLRRQWKGVWVGPGADVGNLEKRKESWKCRQTSCKFWAFQHAAILSSTTPTRKKSMKKIKCNRNVIRNINFSLASTDYFNCREDYILQENSLGVILTLVILISISKEWKVIRAYIIYGRQ